MHCVKKLWRPERNMWFRRGNQNVNSEQSSDKPLRQINTMIKFDDIDIKFFEEK